MEKEEILNLSDSELLEEVNKQKRVFSDLKMAHEISPLENTAQLKGVRKTIARLMTELSKRSAK